MDQKGNSTSPSLSKQLSVAKIQSNQPGVVGALFVTLGCSWSQRANPRDHTVGCLFWEGLLYWFMGTNEFSFDLLFNKALGFWGSSLVTLNRDHRFSKIDFTVYTLAMGRLSELSTLPCGTPLLDLSRTLALVPQFTCSLSGSLSLVGFSHYDVFCMVFGGVLYSKKSQQKKMPNAPCISPAPLILPNHPCCSKTTSPRQRAFSQASHRGRPTNASSQARHRPNFENCLAEPWCNLRQRFCTHEEN